MAEPIRASKPVDLVDLVDVVDVVEAGAHPSGDRAMSALVFESVRDALGRYPLLAADRDDLTQKSVETAFARWESYRASGGTLRAWLGGIVRNEVRHFLRTHRRRAHRETEHALLAATRESETPEDTVCRRDLFDHLIGALPSEQRRILILVRLAEHTIREAAAREGISHSTAHARYQAGMKAFAEAAERYREEQRSCGLLPLPLNVDELLDACRPPPGPSDDFEQAWRHMMRRFGLGEGGPPESGPRARDPNDDGRPSSDPPAITARKVHFPHLLGIALLGGGMMVGAVLGRCHRETVAPAAASPTAPLLVATGMEQAITVSSASSVVRPEPSVVVEHPKGAIPGPNVRRSRAPMARDHHRLRDELALLDRARAALEGGSTTDAFDALAEHARRFPHGKGAPLRERLRADARAR